MFCPFFFAQQFCAHLFGVYNVPVRIRGHPIFSFTFAPKDRQSMALMTLRTSQFAPVFRSSHWALRSLGKIVILWWRCQCFAFYAAKQDNSHSYNYVLVAAALVRFSGRNSIVRLVRMTFAAIICFFSLSCSVRVQESAEWKTFMHNFLIKFFTFEQRWATDAVLDKNGRQQALRCSTNIPLYRVVAVHLNTCKIFDFTPRSLPAWDLQRFASEYQDGKYMSKITNCHQSLIWLQTKVCTLVS